MRNILVRISNNNNRWIKPSPNRLDVGDGEYVKENGFGHEDWNFNKSLTINGFIYGYSRYEPRKNIRGDIFNIAFSIRISNIWYVVGFYFSCSYEESGGIDKIILKRKAQDLIELGNSLANNWRNMGSENMLNELRLAAEFARWKVSPENIVDLPIPVEIPWVLAPKCPRLNTAKFLDDNEMDQLIAAAGNNNDDNGSDYFNEGSIIERLHKSRERNRRVIEAKKESFLISEGKLFCQVCGFNFEEKYGDVGKNYIEGHHTIPLASLRHSGITRESDIALVCSNCHRMIHRNNPFLSIEELKKKIRSEQ